MAPASAAVRVDQPLDMATVDCVRRDVCWAMVHAAADRHGRVVLDLADCDFVDAVGYRMLGDVTRTAERCGLTLQVVRARSDVVRVIGLLDAMLAGDVQTHVESAVAAGSG